MSMGHSSRSSRSIRTSSGRRFLANSLKRLHAQLQCFLGKHRFILTWRQCRAFSGFVGQLGQEFEEVVHDSDVGDLKNRRLGILVDGDQERAAFDSSQVLECATDAASQVDLRLDRFPGGSDLAGLLHPLGVDYGSRATDGGAEHFSQLFGERDVVLFLDAAADGDQEAVARDIDVAGFGDDGLDVAASGHQSVDFRRLVDDDTRGDSNRPGLECTGTDVNDRAGREVAEDVGADLSAELLANEL